MTISDSNKQTTEPPLIGFMCKVDFDHERFEPSDGNQVFSCVEDLLHAHPCANECGIVEVEVRLRRVVKERSDDY